ncbi:hypothetical protein JCGZ_22809 [Jatropha curcas]|uniref:Uncharacterized protein n=1 Tax=Jatropha curcas TaxID=180498 RepID=A0A067L4E2_JATCU|nr:hypothetical protein JCGZ_22809 [Jatropha curcas]
MARGRAFDSDVSGSGSRGVRGLGRSTRARGGTIPPSSSEAVRSSSACLKRYGRASKRLGRILHSRESRRYLRKTGAADESEAESRIDEVTLYLEAVGGEKKGKSACHEDVRSARCWYFSSDPAPATDRNVSTSQQQPLPSPDPDVVDDTLVTPPGDSTLDRADDQPRRFDFGHF